MREVGLLAAGAVYVEDRVHDLAQVMLRWPTEVQGPAGRSKRHAARAGSINSQRASGRSLGYAPRTAVIWATSARGHPERQSEQSAAFKMKMTSSDPANIGSAGTGALLGPGLLRGGGGRIGPGARGPLGGSRWRGSCSRTSNERVGPGRSLIAAGFASGNPHCAEV